MPVELLMQQQLSCKKSVPPVTSRSPPSHAGLASVPLAAAMIARQKGAQCSSMPSMPTHFEPQLSLPSGVAPSGSLRPECCSSADHGKLSLGHQVPQPVRQGGWRPGCARRL